MWQRFDVDVKWQGAPLAHMLRVHGQDFPKLGQTVLHAAAVVAHRGSNPVQLHYLSLLLQVSCYVPLPSLDSIFENLLALSGIICILSDICCVAIYHLN